MQKIVPNLWFDHNAEEAAKFYTKIFKNSKIGRIARYGESGAKVSGQKKGSVMTVEFAIDGQKFIGLNGGPIFKFTPAVSLFVHCKTKAEVDRLFKKLSAGGQIMMPLDKYPFSERYAFFKDKFGVAWQVMLSKQEHIAYSLLFVGKDLGNAEAAVKLYAKVFKKAKVNHIQRYPNKSLVMHASLSLFGQEFMMMDGEGTHHFTFNESISFMINCKDQKEVDYYWNKLGAGGDKKAQVCGWLKDKFGVSWQVVPNDLNKLMQLKDPKKVERVMAAMLKMKKLDVAALKAAAK